MPWEIAALLGVLGLVGTGITIYFTHHRNRREREDRSFKNLEDLQKVQGEERALLEDEAVATKKLEGIGRRRSDLTNAAARKKERLARDFEVKRRRAQEEFAERGVDRSSMWGSKAKELGEEELNQRKEIEATLAIDLAKVKDDQAVLEKQLREFTARKAEIAEKKAAIGLRKP